MRKLKLSLIANKRSRKTTFMKRKKGMMKKLHELTTLCGVQACAVICSPYQLVPESWPSKEGVKEVTSKFLDMPMKARTKKMIDQKTYMEERIGKGHEKVNHLTLENRELQIRQFMFDCVEGKMSKYRYDAMDLHDLQCYIQNYIDLLTQRIEIFIENDATAVTAPDGFYHIQYQNINQNQQESNQHHIPIKFCDFFQNEKTNMNQNHQEPVQHGIYNMNLNEDMNLDSNHNLNLNLNLNLNSSHYPKQQQSSMDLMLEHHIGYAGGHASIPFMDENHYNYNQLPTAGLATINHMSSTITINSVNNNL